MKLFIHLKRVIKMAKYWDNVTRKTSLIYLRWFVLLTGMTDACSFIIKEGRLWKCLNENCLNGLCQSFWAWRWSLRPCRRRRWQQRVRQWKVPRQTRLPCRMTRRTACRMQSLRTQRTARRSLAQKAGIHRRKLADRRRRRRTQHKRRRALVQIQNRRRRMQIQRNPVLQNPKQQNPKQRNPKLQNLKQWNPNPQSPRLRNPRRQRQKQGLKLPLTARPRPRQKRRRSLQELLQKILILINR